MQVAQITNILRYNQLQIQFIYQITLIQCANAPNTPGVYEYWNDFDVGAYIARAIVAHGSADPSILLEADETHNYLSNGDDGYAQCMEASNN